jgi:DNA-binding winged helix-turn-helix (wHTH) protein/TolB-like protein/tetratricopeptide (TPR) repeat protein
MLNKMDRIYQFDSLRVDVANRLLTRAGEIVPLAPKGFDLLLFLVENRGRVLDKETLLDGVWTGVFVEQGNLTKNIFILRKCLGERPDGKPYIQTFSKRGYRFDAAVRQVSNESPAPTPPQPAGVNTNHRVKPSGRSPLGVNWWAAGAALVLAIGWVVWRESATPVVRSLAVLPFRFTGESADAYLADGLAEDLTLRLARLKNLRVIAPQVAARFRDASDPRDAGRSLAVDGVLTGNLRAEGQWLRGRVELISTSDGSILWADAALEVPLHGSAEAGPRLAETVVAGLRLRLSPKELSSVQRESTRNAEAYEALLRGKTHFASTVRSGERRKPGSDGDLAKGFFERAAHLDPNYAEAWAWLSMAGPRRSPAQLDAAAENAEKALRLDADQIVARRALVNIYHQMGRDEEVLPHARWVLAYGGDGPEALAVAGRAFFRVGLLAQGVSLLEQALRKDPQDEVTRSDLAFAYLFSRQYPKMLDVLAPIADQPRARWHLVFNYADRGECDKALELARGLDHSPTESEYFLGKGFEACGDRTSARNLWSTDAARLEKELAHEDSAVTRIMLANEYAELGQRAQALQAIRRAQELGPGNSSVLYYSAQTRAILGDRREAIEYLKQAVEHGYMAIHYLDRYEQWPYGLCRLREDPEYRAIHNQLAKKVESIGRQFADARYRWN